MHNHDHDSPWRPGAFAACGFTAAYLLAAGAGAVITRNLEFVIYIIVMLVIIAAVGVTHRRVNFSTGLLWLLAIWGGAHMAGGLVPVPETWPINGEQRVLYSWWIIPADHGGGWLKFDHLVHAYGFGVSTWLCWQGLRGALRGRADRLRPTVGLVALCVLGSLGLGALNELVEFAATLTVETNVGGYVNTGWDIVSNTIGATVAGVILYAFGRLD